MQADFYTLDSDFNRQLVLTLAVQDGKVVRVFGDDSFASLILGRNYGMNPGQVEGEVGPEAREEFLRRLPRNYSGHRLWAEVVE